MIIQDIFAVDSALGYVMRHSGQHATEGFLALLIECLFIGYILSNCAKALCLRFTSSLKGKFRLTGFSFEEHPTPQDR